MLMYLNHGLQIAINYKNLLSDNPLDLSRIWVLDPDSNRYIEIPYRFISRPALTLWEHRQAMERLRAKVRS